MPSITTLLMAYRVSLRLYGPRHASPDDVHDGLGVVENKIGAARVVDAETAAEGRDGNDLREAFRMRPTSTGRSGSCSTSPDRT